MGSATGSNRVPTNPVVDLVGYGGPVSRVPDNPVVRQNENPAQRVMPREGSREPPRLDSGRTQREAPPEEQGGRARGSPPNPLRSRYAQAQCAVRTNTLAGKLNGSVGSGGLRNATGRPLSVPGKPSPRLKGKGNIASPIPEGSVRNFLHDHVDPGVFDPDAVRILIAAFDSAWQSIKTSEAKLSNEQIELMRATLATYIIEQARHGELDQGRLRDGALVHLA